MIWLHDHMCFTGVGVPPVGGELKDVQENREYFSDIESTAQKSSNES